MPILKAIMLGLIGAIAVPFVMRHETGLVGDWLTRHTISPEFGQFTVPFSPVIFLSVTAFAWLFFIWADR